MSKHDVERAREALNKLGAKASPEYSGKPNGVTAAWCAVIDAAIDLLEHQTKRVMELEREREGLHGKNVALQSQLDAWNKIEQGRLKDHEVCQFCGNPLHGADHGKENECPEMVDVLKREREHGPIPEGWEYAGYRKTISLEERYWMSGLKRWSGVGYYALDDKYHIIRRKKKDKIAKVTITDPHIEVREIESVSHNEVCVSPVSDKPIANIPFVDPNPTMLNPLDPYAEAKATMPEGAEWCGYGNGNFPNAGYQYLVLGSDEEWHPRTSDKASLCRDLVYCRVPLDVPPGPEDVGKPVMVQADCSQSWVRYDSFLCRANGLYWVLDRKIRTLALGFSNARKCREGE